MTRHRFTDAADLVPLHDAYEWWLMLAACANIDRARGRVWHL
jgi:hypothetical protein